MGSRLYPLVLEPIYKYRIWGGRRLEKLLGKKLPPDQPIGESWEVSCRDSDNNVIRNGELAGKTLADVFASSREALLGASAHAARFDSAGAQSRPGGTPSTKFPLLNKSIDANDLLSVQVHPDERTAAAFAGADAKTEAWYIIRADPGARLIR
ncbi:MAG: mannose-6-phosphate isomerase, partial [Candidatus Lindowbacteria bacterium]|nr:mannose-6-phosphate isomerase [Candidatus Lindowbacteria bacterium]